MPTSTVCPRSVCGLPRRSGRWRCGTPTAGWRRAATSRARWLRASAPPWFARTRRYSPPSTASRSGGPRETAPTLPHAALQVLGGEAAHRIAVEGIAVERHSEDLPQRRAAQDADAEARHAERDHHGAAAGDT